MCRTRGGSGIQITARKSDETRTATDHFVGHSDEIELLNESGDPFKLCPSEYLADGVMGRIQHDHFCAGGDRPTEQLE